MALRRRWRRLEAWPVLEPPLFFAWDGSSSAVSLPPVLTSLTHWTSLPPSRGFESLHCPPFIFLPLHRRYTTLISTPPSSPIPLLPTLLLCVHAESAYLSVLCLWERCYAFPKSIFHCILQRMLSWCHWGKIRLLWSPRETVWEWGLNSPNADPADALWMALFAGGGASPMNAILLRRYDYCYWMCARTPGRARTQRTTRLAGQEGRFGLALRREEKRKNRI